MAGWRTNIVESGSLPGVQLARSQGEIAKEICSCQSDPRQSLTREMTVASSNAVNVLLLIFFCVLSGCSETCDPPYTSPASGTVAFRSDQFNLAPGQSWDMKDTVSGDLTHFEMLAVKQAGCQAGSLVDMHITKHNAQDYWQAGVPGAEIHWIMQRDRMSGDWRAAVSLIDYSAPSGPPHTVDYLWRDSNAYLVVPGIAHSNPQERSGCAQWWADANSQTDSCLAKVGIETPCARWTAKLSIQNVKTPVYSGPALLNEEFEGCKADQAATNPDQCAHELWYFAPKVGLVEINAVWENRDIVRIN